MTDGWRAYLQEHRERFLGEALDLLRIPSVSTLPDHADDGRRAANWVVGRVAAAGIEQVRIVETPGHPVVLGEWLGAPGKPTVLVYGHFDTQPADPVELWSAPPFEPEIREGRIYGRGASDDKGNMLAPILALESLLAADGTVPVNVKLLLEGEEEVGSPNLGELVRRDRDALSCDVVLSADGSQYSEDRPQLIMSCRGMCSFELTVRGPNGDRHSGLYGGAVRNPLSALAELVASLHAPDGSIAIDGFYDGVREPSEEERRVLEALPFDQGRLEERLGTTLAGEAGYSTLERIGLRPSLDVNGMWGGFQGEGVKTIIPAEAHAKLSFRLVGQQDPARILALVRAHVDCHMPRGVEVEVRPGSSRSLPYRMPLDHPAAATAEDVLAGLYGVPPFRIFAGPSLPICELFLRELGVYTLFYAFSLEDENIHAPDEFLRVASFERAQAAYCALLKRLGHLDGSALRRATGTAP